ncbi:RNA methyltransferase [Kordiimonas sediminis]|uniref:RNA methyltransferase n=1 Tax=Kordiimonas sediminis TaxID=1735581 RepID=A0A919E7K0_9PROT|nr:class I SAM-dependent RNA methyltransferase [Kordiimonas sediminis]GHF22334.1 RNA methyltransferase [Kordiimonas sediminis]
MTNEKKNEIFITTVPGLENSLCKEVKGLGFPSPTAEKGGVTIFGTWQDVWRANLLLRGATRVLVRLGSFPASHLAKLAKQAEKFPWHETLIPGVAVKVDVTCRKSRIYHSKAAAERIENALRDHANIPTDPSSDICLKVRIVEDVCTVSIDTSGDSLHKRGHKLAVNKAPMRETLASLLLFECGYRGREPVLDPMCGSGTFVIEAAEIAAGLAPGRSRSFAFEKLATFSADIWQQIKQDAENSQTSPDQIRHTCYGYDRDAGAIDIATANADRANVTAATRFTKQAISNLVPPTDTPGLVIINPPYGARLGDVKKLMPLYQSLGKTLQTSFHGWRVGIVTNSEPLAQATGLSFKKRKTAFSHGGIPVKLYSTITLK